MWNPEKPDDISMLDEKDIEAYIKYKLGALYEGWESAPIEAFIMGMAKVMTQQQADYIKYDKSKYPRVINSMKYYQAQTLDYVRGVEDKIKDGVKKIVEEHIKEKAHPYDAAKEFQKLFDASDSYYELLARTEIATADAAGALLELENEGKEYVYIRSMAGECELCTKLISGRIFKISDLKNIRVNYDRKPHEWLGVAPLHPQCRHFPSVATQTHLKLLNGREVPREGIKIK